MTYTTRQICLKYYMMKVKGWTYLYFWFWICVTLYIKRQKGDKFIWLMLCRYIYTGVPSLPFKTSVDNYQTSNIVLLFETLFKTFKFLYKPVSSVIRIWNCIKSILTKCWNCDFLLTNMVMLCDYYIWHLHFTLMLLIWELFAGLLLYNKYVCNDYFFDVVEYFWLILC